MVREGEEEHGCNQLCISSKLDQLVQQLATPSNEGLMTDQETPLTMEIHKEAVYRTARANDVIVDKSKNSFITMTVK